MADDWYNAHLNSDFLRDEQIQKNLWWIWQVLKHKFYLKKKKTIPLQAWTGSKGGFAHSMPCPCYTHAIPLPCRALIHTCHAVPLPCSYSAMSFMKVCVVAGNIRTASPTV